MKVEVADHTAEPGPDDGLGQLHIIPHSSVPPRGKRKPLAAVASFLLALAVHGGFAVLFVLLLQWRELVSSPETTIPVEIVTQMPGTQGGSASGSGGSNSPSGLAAPNEKAAAARNPPPDAAPPKSPDDTAPAGQAPTPAAGRSPATGETPEPPKLVAPPPEAARAATQAKLNTPANAAPDKPVAAQPPPTPPPAEAPQALAAAGGAFAVAPPAPAKPDAAPEPKQVPETPKHDPAADLAAALPMDFTGMPSSFRAVLSGAGSAASDDYKGVVFGKLGRATSVVEEARAKHLRGQVLVSFAIDDKGQLVDLRVAQSSGTPAVDALALQMVKQSAPFPPPPPGGKRVFTPVLSFGAE